MRLGRYRTRQAGRHGDVKRPALLFVTARRVACHWSFKHLPNCQAPRPAPLRRRRSWCRRRHRRILTETSPLVYDPAL